MGTKERILIYAGLVLAIVLALGWKGIDRHAHASAEMDDLRIATVDILSIVQDKLDSEKYRPAREAEEERLVSQRDQIMDRLTEIQRRFEVIADGDPQVNELMQEAQQLQQQLQQFVQQANEQLDRFMAGQVAEAYRSIKNAALEVAGEEGYTHVFASRQSAVELEPEGTTQAMQEILARPLLVAEDADDLTSRVRGRLDMDN